MKRAIFFIIALLLLTACTNNQVGMMGGGKSKPRIPEKKPNIPSYKILQANVLEATRYNEEKKDVDMDQLIEKINKNLERTAITKEEVEQGWYYGEKEDKKLGTPSSWIWIDEGSKSRWVSPNSIEDLDYLKLADLCTKTGGTYIVSCLEREAKDCQYVKESICRCSLDTTWVDEQGCILTDDEGKFIQITPNELRQGWYKGLSNEKKLNTPLSWIWSDNGKDSRWQNPPPAY